MAYLHDADSACAEHQQVFDVVVRPQAAGDDVHGGVAEDAARRQDQQDVAQVRLVLAVKLEPLNPIEEISANADVACNENCSASVTSPSMLMTQRVHACETNKRDQFSEHASDARWVVRGQFTDVNQLFQKLRK